MGDEPYTALRDPATESSHQNWTLGSSQDGNLTSTLSTRLPNPGSLCAGVSSDVGTAVESNGEGRSRTLAAGDPCKGTSGLTFRTKGVWIPTHPQEPL